MTNEICSQFLLSAVMNYVGFDSEDAIRICEEAQLGNKVAQYILGIALLRVDRLADSEQWLHLSAEQGYEPATRLSPAQPTTATFPIFRSNG